ncbi:MAG: AzlD domain-containing protein [Azoarcus sp.]|nr:AzlD domain-containing protein [Azoarcus sp.]
MSWAQFAWVAGLCAVTMFVSRVAPLFLLKGRALPPRLSRALNAIPPAAFAALVANDLFDMRLLQATDWRAFIPWLAAAPVALVALKTRSLLWCIVAGVGCYGALLAIPA